MREQRLKRQPDKQAGRDRSPRIEVLTAKQKSFSKAKSGLQRQKGQPKMLRAVQKEEKPERTLIARAEDLIAFLNSKAGKRYPARNPRGVPTANAETIMCRLREGYSDEDCRAVICRKVREWSHDEKMNHFLTPETLFRRSKFEKYIGELE